MRHKGEKVTACGISKERVLVVWAAVIRSGMERPVRNPDSACEGVMACVMCEVQECVYTGAARGA